MAKSFTSKKNREMLTIAIKFAAFIVTAIVGFFTIQHFIKQPISSATTPPAITNICGVTVHGSNNIVSDNASKSTFKCDTNLSAQ